MDEYRKYGRRKAGTWGKPHKGNRKSANQAVRTKIKRDTKKVLDVVDRKE